MLFREPAVFEKFASRTPVEEREKEAESGSYITGGQEKASFFYLPFMERAKFPT